MSQPPRRGRGPANRRPRRAQDEDDEELEDPLVFAARIRRQTIERQQRADQRHEEQKQELEEEEDGQQQITTTKFRIPDTSSINSEPPIENRGRRIQDVPRRLRREGAVNFNRAGQDDREILGAMAHLAKAAREKFTAADYLKFKKISNKIGGSASLRQIIGVGGGQIPARVGVEIRDTGDRIESRILKTLIYNKDLRAANAKAYKGKEIKAPKDLPNTLKNKIYGQYIPRVPAGTPLAQQEFRASGDQMRQTLNNIGENMARVMKRNTGDEILKQGLHILFGAGAPPAVERVRQENGDFAGASMLKDMFGLFLTQKFDKQFNSVSGKNADATFNSIFEANRQSNQAFYGRLTDSEFMGMLRDRFIQSISAAPLLTKFIPKRMLEGLEPNTLRLILDKAQNHIDGNLATRPRNRGAAFRPEVFVMNPLAGPLNFWIEGFHPRTLTDAFYQKRTEAEVIAYILEKMKPEYRALFQAFKAVDELFSISPEMNFNMMRQSINRELRTTKHFVGGALVDEPVAVRDRRTSNALLTNGKEYNILQYFPYSTVSTSVDVMNPRAMTLEDKNALQQAGHRVGDEIITKYKVSNQFLSLFDGYLRYSVKTKLIDFPDRILHREVMARESKTDIPVNPNRVADTPMAYDRALQTFFEEEDVAGDEGEQEYDEDMTPIPKHNRPRETVQQNMNWNEHRDIQLRLILSRLIESQQVGKLRQFTVVIQLSYREVFGMIGNQEYTNYIITKKLKEWRKAKNAYLKGKYGEEDDDGNIGGVGMTKLLNDEFLNRLMFNYSELKIKSRAQQIPAIPLNPADFNFLAHCRGEFSKTMPLLYSQITDCGICLYEAHWQIMKHHVGELQRISMAKKNWGVIQKMIFEDFAKEDPIFQTAILLGNPLAYFNYVTNNKPEWKAIYGIRFYENPDFDFFLPTEPQQKHAPYIIVIRSGHALPVQKQVWDNVLERLRMTVSVFGGAAYRFRPEIFKPKKPYKWRNMIEEEEEDEEDLENTKKKKKKKKKNGGDKDSKKRFAPEEGEAEVDFLKKQKKKVVAAIFNERINALGNFERRRLIPFQIDEKEVTFLVETEEEEKVAEEIRMKEVPQNMTPQWWKKNPRNDKIIDLTLDIETYDDKEGRMLPYLICLSNISDPKQFVYFFGKDCIHKLLQWFDQSKMINRAYNAAKSDKTELKVNVFTFNGAKFDLPILFQELVKRFPCDVLDMNNLKSCIIKNMAFWDFRCMVSGSLRRVAKSFKVEFQKLEFDHTKPNADNLEEICLEATKYCLWDCFTLGACVNAFFEFATKLEVSPYKLSASKFGLDLFLTSYYDGNHAISSIPENFQGKVSASYRGGVSTAFRLTNMKLETIQEINHKYKFVKIGDVDWKNNDLTYSRSFKTHVEKILADENEAEEFKKEFILVHSTDLHVVEPDDELIDGVAPIAYDDICSSYPYQMMQTIPVEFRYAAQERFRINYGNYESLIEDTHLYAVENFDFMEHIQIPTYQAKGIDGLLWYPMHYEGRQYYWGAEIKFAYYYYLLEPTKDINISEILFFRSEKVFSKYITDLYAKRLEAKKIKDGVGDQMYKILMNGLYGKFGQKQYPITKIVNVEQMGYMTQLNSQMLLMDDTNLRKVAPKFRVDKTVRGEIIDIAYLSEDIFKVELNVKESTSFNHVASYITAQARISLFTGLYSLIPRELLKILCFGKVNSTQQQEIWKDALREVMRCFDKVYYCDTDSCMHEGTMDESVLTNTSELGKFKREKELKLLVTLGPKMYCHMDTHGVFSCKGKGIPKIYLNPTDYFELILNHLSEKKEGKDKIPVNCGMFFKRHLGGVYKEEMVKDFKMTNRRIFRADGTSVGAPEVGVTHKGPETYAENADEDDEEEANARGGISDSMDI